VTRENSRITDHVSLCQMSILNNYRLIIFDKDGTLIHFESMWGEWIMELARRLEAASGQPVERELFQTMGFDSASGRVLADGPLVVAPMAHLRALTVNVLREAGLPSEKAEADVAEAWFTPDPIASARPLADLPSLFTQLRQRGLKIAVITTDDRLPTQATLAGLGVTELVDALACADDGIPPKPAPDMVWAVCQATGVEPAQAVVVGDAVADLQMGRAAGAGQIIGVLSGVSSAEQLTPYADKILPSIAELLTEQEGPNSPSDSTSQMTTMDKNLDEFWEDMLSGEPERVRRAWLELTDEEANSVLQHLQRMADGPDYQQEQKQMASAALKIIREQAE
jgi:phosphoglycolate phosphatase